MCSKYLTKQIIRASMDKHFLWKGNKTMETEDLQALEGLEHTFTDGEKVYGRIFPNEENSNLTEMGKHLAKEVKKNPSKFTRQYDDNMISGDDGTKIAQKQPNTPNIPEEVIIIPHFPKKTEEVIITRQTPKKMEEIKEVANEVTTGENIDTRAKSGVNKEVERKVTTRKNVNVFTISPDEFDLNKPVGKYTIEDKKKINKLHSAWKSKQGRNP
jgi:hypothetical protein